MKLAAFRPCVRGVLWLAQDEGTWLYSRNAFKAATAVRGQNMTDELLKFIESYVTKYSTKPKGRRK